MKKILNACALLGLLWVAQSHAATSSKVWTLDGDFGTGVLESVNHGAPNSHQLQLNTSASTEPYLWVTNYTQDTVTKINTRTGKQVAKYHSVLLRNWDGSIPTVANPSSACNSPSRTAVDGHGNVFAVNRAVCNNSASVTKYAGTLSACVDRNGNGVIETSSDANGDGIIEMNAAEFKGQVDECILFTRNFAAPGDLGRGAAVDADQNLWVSGFSSSKLWKLNGTTGAVMKVIDPRAQTGLASYIYGIAIGPGGLIYTSDIQNGLLMKIDPSKPAGTEVVSTARSAYPTYGLAVDNNGTLFLGSWDSRANLVRVAFGGSGVTYHGANQGGCSGLTRGVAVDQNGDVWTSCYSTNRLLKFSSAGALLGSWPVGSGPVGTAVDGDRKIWTMNQAADTATRYDPVTNTTQSFPTGGSSYSYSDMTSIHQRSLPLPQGTWTVTHDSGEAGTTWGSVAWNEESQGSEPAGTSIAVEARAADTRTALPMTAFVQVANGQPPTSLTGRFIELRVTLRVQLGAVSPVLSDLSVAYTPPDRCFQVSLSDYNLFLLEDYNQGTRVGGKVAAGGTITLSDFSVGHRLPSSEFANALVAGGNLILTNGGVWGDARYGGTHRTDATVLFPRGTSAQQGTPINFVSRGAGLRQLSSQLASLTAHGTATLDSSGGIMLKGTKADVNTFLVPATVLSSATLLSIEAPRGSLAVINIPGTSAALSGFGHSFSGGIQPDGVLYNFTEATSLLANRFTFLGTVLAPYAHVNFNNGSWEGGMYARSLTGSAEGNPNPLLEHTLCP